MDYPLGPWTMGRSRLPACYFFFRTEFTQHVDDYEYAKCVELYGWKYYICCVEAKDQVGLEMQHIGDGIVYTDGIDGSKWILKHHKVKQVIQPIFGLAPISREFYLETHCLFTGENSMYTTCISINNQFLLFIGKLQGCPNSYPLLVHLVYFCTSVKLCLNPIHALVILSHLSNSSN